MSENQKNLLQQNTLPNLASFLGRVSIATILLAEAPCYSRDRSKCARSTAGATRIALRARRLRRARKKRTHQKLSTLWTSQE
eukprot:scaffold106001_cov27-Phaeocystis_antarctica.AAC.1